MEKIPTWKEMEASGEWDDYASMAREFAKLHVQAALKAAKEVANDFEGHGALNEAILDAYSLENIK